MLRRILLFISIALVALVLFITLATDGIIMDGFSRVERSFVMRNLPRAENAIADGVRSLGTRRRIGPPGMPLIGLP